MPALFKLRDAIAGLKPWISNSMPKVMLMII